ncbi:MULTISPECIES: FixH family protein [Fluviicola]|uniref:FixH family protein n=1 Tax=Fluviicola TaxID=332102 RepID=UPI003137990D
MNWGKGIIIGMVLFMGFILTMVVTMMRQKIDLVEEDYYKRELNYEDQLAAQKMYVTSVEKIAVTSEKNNLHVYFPVEFQKNDVTITLRRPNDKSKDLVLTIRPISEVTIPTTDFPKGLFTVTINGSIQGKPYEMSEQVTIK